MPARVKCLSLVLGLALALSSVALAQKAAPDKSAGDKAAAANFDPHDLTGIWNMSFPPNASQADLEVYVSQFGKGEPPMTPWAKERFDKTKPAFGKRGVLVAQTNDPAFQCFPSARPPARRCCRCSTTTTTRSSRRPPR